MQTRDSITELAGAENLTIQAKVILRDLHCLVLLIPAIGTRKF